MTDFPILSILMSLPLFSILAISLTEEEKHIHNIKWVGLWTTAMAFVTSLILWSIFDPHQFGFQFIERYSWVGAYGLEYHVGIDDISLFLILFSTLLFPLAILASWNKIETHIKLYMSCLLFLETLVIGALSSLNLLLVFFFLESILIPLFMIIGIFWGPQKISSMFKSFLYMFLGSLFILLLILTLSVINFPEINGGLKKLLPLMQLFSLHSVAVAGLLIGFIIGGVCGLYFFKNLIFKIFLQEKQ